MGLLPSTKVPPGDRGVGEVAPPCVEANDSRRPSWCGSTRVSSPEPGSTPARSEAVVDHAGSGLGSSNGSPWLGSRPIRNQNMAMVERRPLDRHRRRRRHATRPNHTTTIT